MNDDEQVDFQLDPEDVILLLLEANKRYLGKDSISGITRLEKLLFLLQNETDFEGIGTFFGFTPHKFGPFSKVVYEAVEFLESCELLQIKERTYSTYYANVGEVQLIQEISDEAPNVFLSEDNAEITEKLFFLTKNGEKVVEKIEEAINRKRVQDIAAVKKIICRYGHLPLNQLIRYVYRKYPGTTVNSIHPEATKL